MPRARDFSSELVLVGLYPGRGEGGDPAAAAGRSGQRPVPRPDPAQRLGGSVRRAGAGPDGPRARRRARCGRHRANGDG